MDDSFAYRTTLPPEPRFEPWVVKGAVVGALLVLGIALFTRWVVTSERESFARGSHAVMTSMRVGQIEGTADRLGTDDDAEEATRIALTAARAAFVQRGSFLAADPARLSELQPGFTFVDGPSTMPEIVSVAADRHAWAAAVLGPSGTCFWIRADVAGTISTGSAPGTTSTLHGPVVRRRRRSLPSIARSPREPLRPAGSPGDARLEHRLSGNPSASTPLARSRQEGGPMSSVRRLRVRRLMPLLAVSLLLPLLSGVIPAQGVADVASPGFQGEGSALQNDLDLRVGSVAPTARQRQLVAAMGAKAVWNQLRHPSLPVSGRRRLPRHRPRRG